MTIHDIGLRLRSARREREETQTAVAKAAGIKQPSLSEIETGETKELSGPVLVKICAYLKIRPEWVITGKGPMAADEFGDLAPDERDLVMKYRAASARWRIALQHLAALKSESQDEVSEGTMVLLAKAAATPVEDERLGKKWTRPDKKHE